MPSHLCEGEGARLTGEVAVCPWAVEQKQSVVVVVGGEWQTSGDGVWCSVEVSCCQEGPGVSWPSAGCTLSHNRPESGLLNRKGCRGELYRAADPVSSCRRGILSSISREIKCAEETRSRELCQVAQSYFKVLGQMQGKLHNFVVVVLLSEISPAIGSHLSTKYSFVVQC